jgi:hypothetical protein
MGPSATGHQSLDLQVPSSSCEGGGEKSADGAPVEGTSAGTVLAWLIGCWLLGFGVAWLEMDVFDIVNMLCTEQVIAAIHSTVDDCRLISSGRKQPLGINGNGLVFS